jgi:hypothetical protein
MAALRPRPDLVPGDAPEPPKGLESELLADMLPSVEDILSGAVAMPDTPLERLELGSVEGLVEPADGPKEPKSDKILTFGMIRAALGNPSVEALLETRTLRVDWMGLMGLGSLDAVSDGEWAVLRVVVVCV